MRVTVFGAGSRLGDQIWRKALDDGFQVTILFTFLNRRLKQLAREEPELRLIRVDPHDPNSMRKAIPGQDAVIHCLAMVRSDVRRLVVATTTGDSLDETMTSSIKRVRFPVLSPRTGDLSLVGRDGSEERVIKESPLDWTIVRVPIVNDPERGTELSKEDVATFLVEQLTDPTNIHRKIAVRSSQSPSITDVAPPSEVAPPSDDTAPNEPPAKGKFDDYPLGFNEEPKKRGSRWFSLNTWSIPDHQRSKPAPVSGCVALSEDLTLGNSYLFTK